MDSWLKETEDGSILKLRIQASSSECRVYGLYQTSENEVPRLKIKLRAPPLDGRANEELLGFLKKLLRVPKSSLIIIKGEKSSHKEVLCKGITKDQIFKTLRPFI